MGRPSLIGVVAYGIALLACRSRLPAAEPFNLINNGGFEQDAANGAAAPGWTKIANCYGTWNGQTAGPAKAKEGTWMLHPGAGYRAGGAFQDVRTFVGQQYRLTFWAVGFPDGNNQSVTADHQRGKVQVGTPGRDDRDLVAENGAELVDGVLEVPKYTKSEDWQQFRYEFTATSDTTRITFENIGQGLGRNAINIDHVRMEPVGCLAPEYVKALRRREEEQREREQRWVDAQAKCPNIAYVKRHHFRPPGAGGVLLCWDVFSPGGGIFTFDPQHSERGETKIFDSTTGVVFDMSLSHDARKVLFAWMDLRAWGEDSFHVYEVNIDGTGLRQLTNGRFHDVSPVYLPDGDICFVSTRAGSFSMCQDAPASALHVMEPDGSNIRRIQFGTLADFSPYGSTGRIEIRGPSKAICSLSPTAANNRIAIGFA